MLEGDPRNVLCDAVDKYRAAMLVVGSHGYGTLKRYKFINFGPSNYFYVAL